MSIQLILPEDIETALRRQVQLRGESLESVVIDRLRKSLDLDAAAVPCSEARAETFREWLKEITDLHPRMDHFIDDSRESIYAGCGE